MPDSVAEQIHKAAEALLFAVDKVGVETAEALNSTLNQLLKPPFKAGAATITDSEGSITPKFPSLIYAVSEDPLDTTVKSESVACVLHTAQILGPEELRLGYEQIGIVKRLKRTARQHTEDWQTDAPMGIIFAIEACEPVEKIAERMILLNKSYPSSVWPDMVVILSRGTINYVVQIEGDPIGGDFLLPSEACSPAMPMYVHVFCRSLREWSFNRMCAFLFMQLHVFNPPTRLPEMKEVLEGVSKRGMTLGGYQFNLESQLVPVPDQMYRDRGPGLRHLPFRIEDRKGTLHSHIQFIPWQNGGVLRVIGKMPLEIFLVFLGPAMKGAHRIKRPDGEITSVLPIGQAQFREMLGRFQRQSNMIVKPEQPSWTVSKMADEGTRSPFIARVFLGIMRLREIVFTQATKDSFEKPYEVVLMTILNTRSTCKEIVDMLDEHKLRVAAGKGVRLQGQIIHVDEPIDKELRKNVEDFLASAVRVLKQAMPNVTLALTLDIGFLFKKKSSFENGVSRLQKTHPSLAAYLVEARKWSELLVTSRNAIEHEGWLLPRIDYKKIGETVQFSEPKIANQSVSEFVQYIMDRLCCFVEDVTAYGLQSKMPPDFSITEIPLSERRPECPERFRLALAQGGMPLWSLVYHHSEFDNT